MGAGIAAHLTNAGVPVVLLDIVPEDAKNAAMRSRRARSRRCSRPIRRRSCPSATRAMITPGNTEDDLKLLAGECDWIIEAGGLRTPRHQAWRFYKKIDKPAAPEGLDRLFQHLDHPAARRLAAGNAGEADMVQDFVITPLPSIHRATVRLLEVGRVRQDATRMWWRPSARSATSASAKAWWSVRTRPASSAIVLVCIGSRSAWLRRSISASRSTKPTRLGRGRSASPRPVCFGTARSDRPRSHAAYLEVDVVACCRDLMTMCASPASRRWSPARGHAQERLGIGPQGPERLLIVCARTATPSASRKSIDPSRPPNTRHR